MEYTERINMISRASTNGEVKSIRYKDENKAYEVKEIPLEALLYNPYNGRIRSMILSFESAQNRKINNESKNDIETIEQFLYDSTSGKNEKTKDSLREIGQQEVGIITKDGVIIDGNRRACLLNILKRNNHPVNTFKAIVLDDELRGNEKFITLLETRYQMGVDSKVEYNPIEKYIRCDELLNIHHFTISEISELMAESETTIKEWLSRFELMNNYLNYLDTPKLYTRLEKREGHFIDLRNYLNTYNYKANSLFENPKENIDELKDSYFDYIRLGVPVQRARVIAKPSKGNSFFSNKEIWDDFISEHKKIKSKVIEKSFSQLKAQFPLYNNEEIIKIIDTHWQKEIKDNLLENLSFNEISLKEISESFMPLKNLKRVRNTLNNTNLNNIDRTTISEMGKVLNDIQTKVEEIKESLNQL
jgi:ParB-like chromosome segregation protein Spo0J